MGLRTLLGAALAMAALVAMTAFLAFEGPEAPPPAAPPPVAEDEPGDAEVSEAFFARGPVVWVEIEIAEPFYTALRRAPREYVPATVREGEAVYHEVGIHLKGQRGSFRPLDSDKPALTLNFDKYTKGQRFYGMDKLHLNNSVQDPSYLCELICGELFQAAGVPAARVAHARVKLNGDDLGFYVLKEGFDKTFLKRHFDKVKGNLYDGGFLDDVTSALEKKSGDGPDDGSDLEALAAAAVECLSGMGESRLARVLDVERFLAFAVVESMTEHWDGYVMKSNNYKLYRDPKTERFVFLPHGLDQMFGGRRRRSVKLLPARPRGLVARAVLSVPAWRERYLELAEEYLRTFFTAEKLTARIDAVAERILPAVLEGETRRRNSFPRRVAHLRAAVADRVQALWDRVERGG